MEKINQDEVNSILWKAYYSFKKRGNEFIIRDYVAALFLLKYISDRSGDEDFHIITIDDKSDFNYIYSNRHSDNIADLINECFGRLEENNKCRLRGVFTSLDYNCKVNFNNEKEKKQAIVKTLEELNALKLNKDSLENINIPANSFALFIESIEYMLSKKSSNNYVPMELSQLIVELLNPKEGESIYDSSCGIGELLAISYNKAKNYEIEISGQVKDESSFRLCKINMILNNVKNEDIRLGDVLVEPLHLEGNSLKKFDIVLSYPHYLSAGWIKLFDSKDQKKIKEGFDPYNRFELGIPPFNKSDYFHILHMLSSLSDKGRMAALLYPGVLFRGGSEGEIRKNIIEKNLLNGIIILPERMLIHTSIPTIILLFEKNRKKEDVLMIDASLENYIIRDRHINKLKPDIAEKIVHTYNDFQEYEGFSRKVSIEEIRDNDYNLHVPRYLLPSEEIARLNLNELKHNIMRIKADLAEVEYEIEGLINRGN